MHVCHAPSVVARGGAAPGDAVVVIEWPHSSERTFIHSVIRSLQRAKFMIERGDFQITRHSAQRHREWLPLAQ